MTEVDTGTVGQHGNPPDGTAAGRTDPASSAAPEAETDTDAQDHADDPTAGDGENVANEAKRYRLRLRETERERDALQQLLDRTRQAIVDHAVSAAGMDPRLMTAAGHTMETLVGDDGLIDHDALSAAIDTTAREFRVPPSGLTPNPQQGSGGGPMSTATSWSKALKGKPA